MATAVTTILLYYHIVKIIKVITLRHKRKKNSLIPILYLSKTTILVKQKVF